MKNIHYLIALILIVLIPSFVLADDQTSKEETNSFLSELDDSQILCAAGSPWYEFGKIDLEIFEKTQNYRASWSLEIAENHDLRLTINQPIGSEEKKGEILVISGKSMVTKGLDLSPGYEIDSLDGPVLMCQLAISLLHFSFPDGPQSIKGESPFELSETQRAIKVATPSASGLFGAPWSIEGFVKKTEEKLIFQMTYSFKPSPQAPNPIEMKLSGIWDGVEKISQIPDSFSLKGWKINHLGPYKQEVDGGTIFDYGARPQAVTFNTVGDLRKNLEKKEEK